MKREKELVQHSKDEVARLRSKCQELTLANQEAIHEIKQPRDAKREYKALHLELGKELDRRFVFQSVASIIKSADSEGVLSFNFDELDELTNTTINKIHDASEDNDFPLFKELVTEYMQAWKESQKDAEKSDEEEDEDQEDNEDGKDDEGKEDNDDGDNDQRPVGKDQLTGKEDDEEDQEDREQREDPQEEEAGFRREVRKHPTSKGESSKGKQHTDGSPSLVSLLQDIKQAFVWKIVVMRQMFGKWQLQVKLGKMAAYIEKRFTTSATPT